MPELDPLLDDYLDDALERNPHVATVLGMHDYDDELPSGTRASVEEEIDAARGLLDDIDDGGFEGYDAELVRASLEYDLYEMDELRLWERDPQAADAVVSFVYPLYTRDFAPFEERLEPIAARLEDVPDYLEESRDRVVDPVGIWVEAEAEACDEVVGFLQLVADEAGELERQDLAYRVSVACQGVADALDEHREWLASLETSDGWRVGRDALDRLLELRRLPDSETVVAWAEDELDAAEEELAEATGEVADDPREAVERIEGDRPAPDELLDTYTEAVRDARGFADDTVGLPDEAGVNVAETPDYLRPLVPETAYFEPTPFGDEVPTYYVTPNDTHLRAEVVGNAVSDIYPGAHLRETFAARGSKASLLAGRFNAFGDDFVEGWVAHAERLAVAHGYGGAEMHAYRGRNRVGAACRAVVDVKLQTGEMSVRDAAEFLVEEAGVPEGRAVVEAREFGREPGARVSRLVGARLLSDVYDGWEGDEKELHTRLLKGGSVPVEFHEKRL